MSTKNDDKIIYSMYETMGFQAKRYYSKANPMLNVDECIKLLCISSAFIIVHGFRSGWAKASKEVLKNE